ncbi:S-layer homology domain-containing protein [Paenibacillus athensensis]|uniref:SLH domain-containing protein n=1 Tax=Paenibacillus athensensis TaxID=1967502 RepID=A0A4Y8PVL7_9BACL|nr:S-layer homology domain-containing protein [Paenibacillus athensensis]MCD1258791.1 S-layer homology domain-containing protein [Paenibacillus athensensis]
MKMEFKRVTLSFALCFTLLAPAAYAADEAPLTRGEFIHLLTSELQLAPASSDTALPSDVAEGSAYANDARALLERKILNGYEDGTLRLDQPITVEQSAYIVGRLLGLSDSSALAELKERFGAKLGDAAPTAEQALGLVRTALRSDESAVEWLKAASSEQAGVNTYRSETKMNLRIFFKPGVEDIPDQADMKATSMLEFNKAQGMHQTVKFEIHLGDTDTTTDMEQFFTDNGSYMKTVDPSSGEMQWFDTTAVMPFKFSEVIKLQQENMDVSKLITPYFFYRDLGVTEEDGKQVHKISMNGKLADTRQLIQTLGNLLGNSALLEQIAQTPGLSDMSMSISGVQTFDEATKLPLSQEVDYIITYGDALPAPIDHLSMSLTSINTRVNEPVEITVPEEAKSAKPLPGIGSGAGIGSGLGSDADTDAGVPMDSDAAAPANP